MYALVPSAFASNTKGGTFGRSQYLVWLLVPQSICARGPTPLSDISVGARCRQSDNSTVSFECRYFSVGASIPIEAACRFGRSNPRRFAARYSGNARSRARITASILKRRAADTARRLRSRIPQTDGFRQRFRRKCCDGRGVSARTGNAHRATSAAGVGAERISAAFTTKARGLVVKTVERRRPQPCSDNGCGNQLGDTNNTWEFRFWLTLAYDGQWRN